ncbi:GDSL-like Lipase/Acylhydrolase family protein [Streptomyces sp. 2131.1]|nr:GDSL-like Lipase/Acylhydrolase family protein [Streptomyces sp. 2131.1]
MMHRTRRGETVSKRRTAVALAAPSSCALTVAFPGAASAVPQGAHGAPRFTYVALGDSYPSGPRSPRRSTPTVRVPTATTRRSPRATRQITSFTDVSCGGATTAEMWQARGANGLQLGAVKRDTDLVTLQIGGNDVGFRSINGTCAGLSAKDLAGNPWQQHYRAGGYDQLTLKILRVAPKVAAYCGRYPQREGRSSHGTGAPEDPRQGARAPLILDVDRRALTGAGPGRCPPVPGRRRPPACLWAASRVSPS